MISLFLGIGLFIDIPIVSSENNILADRGYDFKDVDVLIIGRSSFLVSWDNWSGGLVIGDMDYFVLFALSNSSNRFNVFLRDRSSGEFFFKSRLTHIYIEVGNSSGIFYFGSVGPNYRNVPPLVFIRCHAEGVWIRDLKPI